MYIQFDNRQIHNIELAAIKRLSRERVGLRVRIASFLLEAAIDHLLAALGRLQRS